MRNRPVPWPTRESLGALRYGFLTCTPSGVAELSFLDLCIDTRGACTAGAESRCLNLRGYLLCNRCVGSKLFIGPHNLCSGKSFIPWPPGPEKDTPDPRTLTELLARAQIPRLRPTSRSLRFVHRRPHWLIPHCGKTGLAKWLWNSSCNAWLRYCDT